MWCNQTNQRNNDDCETIATEVSGRSTYSVQPARVNIFTDTAKFQKVVVSRQLPHDTAMDVMGLIVLSHEYQKKAVRTKRTSKLSFAEANSISQTMARNQLATVSDIIMEKDYADLGASIIVSEDTQRITIVFRANGNDTHALNTTQIISSKLLTTCRDVAGQQSLAAGVAVRTDLMRKLWDSGAFELLRKAVLKKIQGSIYL